MNTNVTKSVFTLNKKLNSHNYRYWAQDNVHKTIPTKSQQVRQVNVWAGIFGPNVIGPFFIDKLN